MNNIRAKFYCTQGLPDTTAFSPGEVILTAQYSDNPDDNEYSMATPSGSVKMFISNPNVAGFFVQGEQYYMDFTKVIKKAE